jgi:hypothetical protein
MSTWELLVEVLERVEVIEVELARQGAELKECNYGNYPDG